MARLPLSSAAGPSENVSTEVKVKLENRKGKQKARFEEETEEDVDAEGEEDEEGQGEGDEEEEEEDNEQDANGEEEEDEEGASPRGSKRTRVNEDGDSRPGNGSKPVERVKTLPRDTDGYIPGSILRIQLKNFVTYDSVEFRVGPYLNMILGPNGTGKSSIACAICLGLNFPPSVNFLKFQIVVTQIDYNIIQVLGRAAELNSFVKIGKASGHIEIELKGRKGRGNLVIRRTLSATSKHSSFTLNGQPATGKEINARMAELNVQVGNLCSFLPQDKVSEFAQMSPQELLRQTQRAAGDERLTSWHDTLITAGKELKSLLQNIQDESNQVRQMRDRNEGIERDVQRFKERQNIEARIALLELLIPVERYRSLRIKYQEVKTTQRKLHQKVKKLKAKNEPAHALLKKFEADHKEYDKSRDEFKKTTVAKLHKMKVKWTASEKLEGEAEEVTLKLERLKQEEKERVRKISVLEAEIQRTQKELDRLSEIKLEDLEGLRAEAKQVQTERSDVELRKSRAEDGIKSVIDKKAQSNSFLNNAYADLKKLDDIENVKMQNLQRWDRNCHDAVLWLRNNKHKFKMEVFEPALLSVRVPNQNFVDAVEAGFNATQLKAKDSETLNHQVHDQGVLGKDVRISVWFRSQSQLPPPPMSREEAVSRNGTDVPKAMELVARPETGGGATFFNKRTMNIVSRSQYGQRNVSNMTRDIRSARNFANVTVDADQKRKIDDRITQLQEEISNYAQEEARLKNEHKQALDEGQVFVDRMNAINKRRDKIKETHASKVKCEAKMEREKNKLEELQSRPSVETGRANLKKQLLKITKQRIQIAKEYTHLARSIIGEQTEATRMGIHFLQIGANKAALQDLCNRKDEKYNNALAEFDKVDEEFRTVKEQAKTVLDEVREMQKNIPEELRVTYDEIEAKRTQYDKELLASRENGTAPPSMVGVELRSLDELEAELETQRANLELNTNTDAGVVEQYEKRKRDIEVLEKTIETKQKSADKIDRSIKSARDNWQPALEKLVASIGDKFSKAFDRIGCAGEVRISQHEDYEKWAIDILVKFRDTEKLQLLTGQRQSGGERSLTTILYLMSLTEEARAPFSLVDEINQGMDQRAERSVHNSMVQVTCKEDSAQYFLITPKLLPDLEYHERMKILCVNNGEWLPEEHDLGNMMNMIDGYLAQNQ
ncbi:hypothetical protein H0H92_004147 [Tricholoma furcatifolium]|nr:hypothetical protein H0H92_004147 [Tricholoma furcatifolium]